MATTLNRQQFVLFLLNHAIAGKATVTVSTSVIENAFGSEVLDPMFSEEMTPARFELFYDELKIRWENWRKVGGDVEPLPDMTLTDMEAWVTANMPAPQPPGPPPTPYPPATTPEEAFLNFCDEFKDAVGEDEFVTYHTTDLQVLHDEYKKTNMMLVPNVAAFAQQKGLIPQPQPQMPPLAPAPQPPLQPIHYPPPDPDPHLPKGFTPRQERIAKWTVGIVVATMAVILVAGLVWTNRPSVLGFKSSSPPPAAPAAPAAPPAPPPKEVAEELPREIEIRCVNNGGIFESCKWAGSPPSDNCKDETSSARSGKVTIACGDARYVSDKKKSEYRYGSDVEVALSRD